MSQSSTLDIGWDVDTDSMAIASVAAEPGAEVTSLGTSGTRQGDIAQRVRQRHAKATHVVFVYDAGPCGSWLSRYLTHKGHHCWVVAPSLIPQTAGDRVQTDRRDAIQLARLMRSGELTPVDVPAVADDAIRDRSRAREDAIADRKAAQFRLNALFLRHDLRSTGRATWGPAPLRWLAAVVCATPAHHIVFQAYGRAVHEHTARLQRLVQALPAQVTAWRRHPVVEALEALRGVPCTVAVTLVTALGDLTRFATPRPLLTYLGLIPAAYSRGERRRQGASTQAGNTHARRALVEGAWAYRDPATGSRPRPRRREPPPQPIQALSGKAPVRRCQGYRRLIARGQHANPVVVAMARELAGFLGAMAQPVPVKPSSRQTIAMSPTLQTACHV